MNTKIHAVWILLLLFSMNLQSGYNGVSTMVEVCDNGIDDDGDNFIDLNDSDCECLLSEPESLIPNPSFEEQECCPSGRSQLSCATDWVQASLPTTDYIHTCGYLGWEGIPAPFPYPDGDGIIGFRDGRTIQGRPELNWKEYLGACLNAPLKAGTEYSFEFQVGFVSFERSPAINITFFGTPDCDYLPFGQEDEAFGCPTNGPNWVRLGSNRVSGRDWVTGYIQVTPQEDIYAIAIGPSCEQITNSINTYYFFDNLVLAETRLFPKRILEIGNSCLETFELIVNAEPGATYQWYKDGVALVGETLTSYAPNFSEGEYRVMQYLDGQCNLSEPYFFTLTETSTNVGQIICEDEEFEFGGNILSSPGSYTDTLKTIDGCDSIVVLELEVLGDTQDSMYARIFPEDELRIQNFTFTDEGNYDFTLESSAGCDSLVHLDLDFYRVFIPNTFSPNEDGFNDIFEVFIEEPDLLISSISIYNRWGSEVFKSDWSEDEEGGFWDGRFSNGDVEEGVYTYLIEFRVGEDFRKLISGDVTVVL